MRGTVGGRPLALGNMALMAQLGVDAAPLAVQAEVCIPRDPGRHSAVMADTVPR